MTESRLTTYKAFLTPFDHSVVTKNTHDDAMYAFTTMEAAILAAGDLFNSEYSVNSREGVFIVTELTSSERDAGRGFGKLRVPMYLYAYPPSADNELQPDGTMKINKQTVGNLILNLVNPLEHLITNSYNIVFRSFEVNAQQPLSVSYNRETAPSAKMPTSWGMWSDLFFW